MATGTIPYSTPVKYGSVTATGTASYGIISLGKGNKTIVLNATTFESIKGELRFDTTYQSWIFSDTAFKDVIKTVHFAYIEIP